MKVFDHAIIICMHEYYVQGGVLLGPSVIGKNLAFAHTIFPLRSVMVLETMANVGLLYFLFLVGVEMDLTVIWRSGKKSLAIALTGMIIPFMVGAVSSYIVSHSIQRSYILFLGICLSVTAFPVLARVLAELKLINTEIGKVAMSAALVNDVLAWILLAVAISLRDGKSSTMSSFWVIFSNGAFVAFCMLAVRPAISWMIKRTPEGENFSELQICLILTGVMVSGFVTDAMGTHSVFGAFVFGLIIPNGPLGMTLVEKLEDFISGLLLPLFFAISGLKTDLHAIKGLKTWGSLLLIVFLASAGKVAGTLAVCAFYRMPVREGITLGLLMNTKGLVEMIIINLGRDQKVIYINCILCHNLVYIYRACTLI